MSPRDRLTAGMAAELNPGPAEHHAESVPIPLREISWHPSFRIIPTRFPPIAVFERVAPPEDWDALIELESLTNDRIRDQIGEISLVPAAERVFGPGAGYIMATFTHLSPTGGRFTDGTYGAYYAAGDLDTAIAETIYHRERFLRATDESPLQLDMQVLEAKLRGRLHDLRGLAGLLPAIYHPEDYTASRTLAQQLRAADSAGIVYDSVRRAGGECAVSFRPRLLSRCRATRHLTYVWDGERIAEVYEKRPYRRKP